MGPTSAEHKRLAISEARQADWKNWGPYVADRAWGTVREDYSQKGEAWSSFPHADAHRRAYRWNEDGIGGVSNRFQNLCMSVVLWNERDPILKERFFGLTGHQGNHGEDVKEYYFYLDSTPTHSYMKMLYKYPQEEYPYDLLVNENHRRGRDLAEFELFDALGDAFERNRYFDVVIEYAKADQEDILCRITAINRGPTPAPIHVLPHIWFRNTWSWGHNPERPTLQAIDSTSVAVRHRHLGDRWWYVDTSSAPPRLLFTDNDTNTAAVYGDENHHPYVKDGIHEAVVNQQVERVNSALFGTKAAAHYRCMLGPGESFTAITRMADKQLESPLEQADEVFQLRKQEADEFYAQVQDPSLNEDDRNIQRQAFAGLLWTKQFYHYSVDLWLRGDPTMPAPPDSRSEGRNAHWRHLHNLDVISMPDKWEYPWYAAWDLAFHTLPLAMIDPAFAKRQLVLLLREWYMHPNGQIPAYEWNFGDVNPPVHAWAAWRVYKIDRNQRGQPDIEFLEEVFHKLLLNFTWWVNRKDSEGHNIFEGGFLGLDNIGVFDRSKPVPIGVKLEQADATGWMGMYCLNMLAISLELARHRRAYEAVATKFFEHFMYIAHAINCSHRGDQSLWDEQDGFYYDLIQSEDGSVIPLKIRSFVGLIPVFAVETLDAELLQLLPRFRRRMEWFVKYRPHLVQNVASLTEPGQKGRRLLSLLDSHKLRRILPRMLDPSRFLSDFGLRSLSRQHKNEPFALVGVDGQQSEVTYEPGESQTHLFGGNSNWRGPIWFPLNYLMIESLQKYHHYYGDTFRVEFPRYSANDMTLHNVAREISSRLIRIFQRDPSRDNRRPVWGMNGYFSQSEYWRDLVPFYEYFHGETGQGLGASHQTGWTALVAKLIQQCSRSESSE